MEDASRRHRDPARRLEHAGLRRLGVGARHGHRRLRHRALEPERPDPARPHGPARRERAGLLVGDSIRIDTGANQEEKVIASVGTAGANGSGLTLTTPLTIVHAVGAPVVNLTNPDTGISFTPALDQSHAAGALVTGSGNNIAASDPSAGAAVTPRMIARLEITYANGSTDVVVSDRSWRTAFGAYVTDAWYAGSDYDARREPVGWDEPGADLSDDRDAA